MENPKNKRGNGTVPPQLCHGLGPVFTKMLTVHLGQLTLHSEGRTDDWVVGMDWANDAQQGKKGKITSSHWSPCHVNSFLLSENRELWNTFHLRHCLPFLSTYAVLWAHPGVSPLPHVCHMLVAQRSWKSHDWDCSIPQCLTHFKCMTFQDT